MEAGIGFATHSGWAVSVTAGLDDAGHLRVVDRRRVELIAGDLPRQAYHEAAGLALDAAEELVARVDASIVAYARAVLRAAREGGAGVSIAGVAVLGEPREIPRVQIVLASHARMHACEGEQYRRGIVEAANELAVPALRIGPAQLARIERMLGWDVERTQRELATVRSVIGPPWQTDHKQAALAALGVLTLDREADEE
jgi:hypothetical protein